MVERPLALHRFLGVLLATCSAGAWLAATLPGTTRASGAGPAEVTGAAAPGITAAPVPVDGSSLSGAAAALGSGLVDVDGGQLFYERTGAGPALVMIHDGLVHREIWDGQLEVFASSYTVIRYDRRGFGRSPRPEQPYSNVDDLLRLLDALSIGRATLMGMSAGGGLAIDFTVAHPERVEGLVLVGAVLNGFPFTQHFFDRGGHRDPANRTDQEDSMHYWIDEDPYEIAAGNTEAKERAWSLLSANPQNVDDAKYRLARPAEHPALRALGDIDVPTLVIVGEYDIPDVHAHAGAISAGIPRARRVIVPGAGHLVPIERPEAFNELVPRLLEEEAFSALIERAGAVAALAEFERRRVLEPDWTPFDEPRMNAAGYALIQEGRLEEAMHLFELNVRAYPDSWNVHDSLGEVLMMRGERRAAIESYERSLELNPGNQNAVEMLAKLRSEE